MSNLKSNFVNYLPLNRKERFYTGTVIPQIICYDNFKNIYKFLNLINNFPKDLTIKPDAIINNIQFLTEYSLKESANFDTESLQYENVPITKETPDIVILITEPELYLILVEVKMYSGINYPDFIKQLQDQKKMVKCIQGNLNILDKNIFHLGLVPKTLFKNVNSSEFQILYVEDILNEYRDLLSNNYFFTVLQLSVDKYSKLKSKNNGSSFGKNMDCMKTGSQIIDLINQGKKFIVGRRGGVNGEKLSTDIKTGQWKNHEYEVNFRNLIPINLNWLTSDQFYSKVTSNSQKQ